MADELLIKKSLEKALYTLTELKYNYHIWSMEEWYVKFEEIREPLLVYLEGTPMLATYKRLFSDVRDAYSENGYKPVQDAVNVLLTQARNDIRVLDEKAKGSNIHWTILGVALAYGGYKVLKYFYHEESKWKGENR